MVLLIFWLGSDSMVANPQITNLPIGSELTTDEISNYLRLVIARPWWGVVIHHSADEHDMSAQRIDDIHRNERHWASIGYHFVIRKSGMIEVGRPLSLRGAHSGDYRNDKFIGVCVTGDDTFTKEQYESLIVLIKNIFSNMFVQPGLFQVHRHHDKCPGGDFRFRWLMDRLKTEFVMHELDVKLHQDATYQLKVFVPERDDYGFIT